MPSRMRWRLFSGRARTNIDLYVYGAIPMVINESLSEYKSVRLKKAMRLKTIRFADGGGLDAVQEDWEGGLTLFLATSRAAGEKFSVVIELEGDFMSHYADDIYSEIPVFRSHPLGVHLRKAMLMLEPA